MVLSAPPEPGQFVEVGRRLFMVTNVAQIEPSEDPTLQRSDGWTHTLRLMSLEEDAFGDVEEVTWENEPGIRTRERPGLPDLSSLGNSDGCNEVMDAVRWGVADFIRRALGAVGPDIDEQVEIALLDGRLDLDTYWTEREIGSIARALIDRGLIDGGPDADFFWSKKNVGGIGCMFKPEKETQDHLQRLKKNLKDAGADIGATPERLKAVVDLALKLARQPRLTRGKLVKRPENPVARSQNSALSMPNLHGGWAMCAEGLEHPHTGEVRPITFDHKIACERDDVVLCHLSHPMVQMSQRVLRGEIWVGKEAQKLSRLEIKRVDEHQFGHTMIVHARLLVTGGTGQLLYQDVIHCGCDVARDGPQKFGMTSREIENAKAASLGPDEIDFPEISSWFTERWSGSDGLEAAAMRALDARARDRMGRIQPAVVKRRKQEIRDQINPLRELAQEIRRELKAESPDQGGGGIWGRGRRNKKLAALRAQLAPIEAKVELGAREIKDRHDDLRTWVFPATVTLLYPVEIKYPC